MSLDELRRSFLIIIEPLQNYVFDFWVEKENDSEYIPEDIRFGLRHVSVTAVIVIYAKLLSILLLIDEKTFDDGWTIIKTAGWKCAEKTGESS